MPKRPIYKNYEFVFLQADIGFAGEWFLWGFVSDACMPQRFLEELFRFGVFALDPGHIEGMGFGGIEAVFLAEPGYCCLGSYVRGVFQRVKVMGRLVCLVVFDRN